MKTKSLKPLSVIQTVLRSYGLYCDKSQTKIYHVFGFLFHFLTVGLFQLFGIFQIFTKQDPMAHASKIIFMVCVGFCYFTKNMNNYWRSDSSMARMKMDLEKLIEFSFDERFKDRKHINEEISFINVIFKGFVVLDTLTVVMFMMFSSYFRRVPFVIYYPFDIETNDIGIFVAIMHQLISTIYAGIHLICFNLLPLYFICYAIGLIKELAERISYLGESKDLEYIELMKCVEIFRRIENLVKQIQKNFGVTFSVQGFLTVFTLCSGAYGASTAGDFGSLVQSFFLCLPMIYEMLLPCYFGAQLIESKENLKAAVFHSDWHNTDLKTRRKVLSFMRELKSGKALSISMLGLEQYDLNLITITRIADITYSTYSYMKNNYG